MQPDTNYYLQKGESTPAYNQRIAAYNASKNTTPTKPSPTVGSLYGSVSDADKFVDSSTNYYKGIAETSVDEGSIRSSTMRALQAEIDATNNMFAEKLREAQQQGLGRVGSGTAIQARRGLLGSDFGASQTQSINDENTSINNGIRAEQSAAISAITGRGNKMAQEEIAAKNAARQQGAEAYLKYLGEGETRRTTRTTEAAKRALAAGFDLSSADDASIKAIADSYQISPDTLRVAYKDMFDAEEAAKVEAEAQAAKDALAADLTRSTISKNGRMELSEGSAVYDAQGNRLAYNPKTYKPEVSSSVVGIGGNSPFVAQQPYTKLTAKQKTQADSLNNLVRSLKEYKDYYNANPGAFNGRAGNVMGKDSGVLATKLNSIIFAAAQAEGTGALQQADREVIEQIVPNPTNAKGAVSTLFRGGKEGNIARIEDQINKYTNNLSGYGLQPVFADTSITPTDGLEDDEAYQLYLQTVGE